MSGEVHEPLLQPELWHVAKHGLRRECKVQAVSLHIQTHRKVGGLVSKLYFFVCVHAHIYTRGKIWLAYKATY